MSPNYGVRLMRIERRYTKAGQSPYATIAVPSCDERDPQSGRLGRLPAGRHRGARGLEPGRRDVLAQKYFRKAGVPARLKKVEENDVPSFLWRSVRRRGRARRAARRTSATAPRSRPSRSSTASPAAGPIGAGRAAISPPRRTRSAFYDELRFMLATQMVAPELAAMVQHRPALGLRHRRAEPGPFLRRLQDRQADQVEVGLRAPAAACLLHPGRGGRPRQRGRHHGPVGARGAPVQIRLRHRLELLEAARRRREALRRRPLVRPDVASSRSATARPARSSRAAPRAARPRWSWSMSITPISRPTSTGR